MRIRHKIKTAARVMRNGGIAGVRDVGRAVLMRHGIVTDPYRRHSLLSDSPMFRYATCDDLFCLMARYPQYCRVDRDSEKSHARGLKSMGTLFCAHEIARLTQPPRILEIGAGCNRSFDRMFGRHAEYWMLDDVQGPRREKFEWTLGQRPDTHFVRGMIGQFSDDLSSESFDVVFSISVLEHVPQHEKPNVYRDMFRLLKPGGVIVHSIDLASRKQGQQEYNFIADAGFVLPAKPYLRVCVRPYEGPATLFEDLWTVFNGYFGLDRADPWGRLESMRCHYPTILVRAKKPDSRPKASRGSLCNRLAPRDPEEAESPA